MTRLPATTVNDDSLRRSIGVSAFLHLAILLFLYFGLPVFIKPLPKPFVPIPIDIVDIAELTNTRLKDQPQEQPKPDEPPPPPAQKVAPPPPQPTPPTLAPPEPPKPPEAKPEQVQAITPIPKPTEKPTPPKKEEKPHQDMLASVLKNVEKMKPAEPVKSETPVKTQTQTQPKSIAPSLSDRLTVTEEDALRRQIEQCWNPPIGARNAQTLVVEVNITVNPDRTVQTAEVVDKSRVNSDPYFRSAAEAAIRALYNPRCSPLELPEGKYEQWKVIDFNFDPRDML